MHPQNRNWPTRVAVLTGVVLLIAAIGFFAHQVFVDAKVSADANQGAPVSIPSEAKSAGQEVPLADDPLVERFRSEAKDCRELFLRHRAVAKEAYHAEGDRAEALQKEEKALDRKFAKLYSNLYDRIQALPKDDDRRAVLGGLWKQISE